MSIHEKVNIDYAKYHALIKGFKQTMGITADSILLVRLTVNTKSTVGIGTHRLTTNNHTRGIRLTTTVLRFLFQNSYLN